MSHNSPRTQAYLPLLVCHVAVRLQLSERTVRWLAAKGYLRAHRIGIKIWAFAEADVDAFARSRNREREAA